jgi:RNA polymerase sigma factor (TIGR02999 family)
MANEAVGHTLQPTALVHEAFVRLLGHDEEVKWDSRGHFFAAAAEAMRRILVENARHKKTLKRNRGGVRIELKDEDAVVDPDDSDELLALDDALTRLASVDHELARLVELRYFSGLSIEETAKVLNISPSTTKRNWAYARAWLRREIDGEKNENS